MEQQPPPDPRRRRRRVEATSEETETDDSDTDTDTETVRVSSAALSSLRTRQKLVSASVICGCFVVVEFVGGALSGSLAVWSDAAHLCTDLCAFHH